LGENPIKLKCKLKKTKNKLDTHIDSMKRYKENNFKISEDVDFNPNSPYTFHNPLFFGVSATCDISSPAPENFFGQVTEGGASINGNNIPPEGLHLTVNNGDKFNLHANGFTSASITNQGDQPVHAHCGVGVVNFTVEEFEQKLNELLDIKKTLEIHEAFFDTQENLENLENIEELIFGKSEALETLKFLA